MDKNKKVITGLLAGSAAINSAAIIAILTIRCSDSESINDHILHKIKELDDEVISKTNDLVNNPDSREIFNNAQKMYDDALLKEKEIEKFIFENKLIGKEIDEVLEKLNADIDKLKKQLENNKLYNKERAKELIDKLSNNNPEKEKLLEKLNKSDFASEELWDIIEKTQDLLNKAKKEALKEINKLNDSQKKNELLQKVSNPNAKEEDYLSAKQEAINELEKARDKAISQINRLDNSSEKEKLLKIVNNLESTEEEINKSKESAENLLNKAKENALKELEKLTGSTKKDELSEKLNKENILQQEIKNIVNEVNEIFENEKERVKQLINSELTTDAEKENLLTELEKAKNIEEIKLVEAKIAPIKEIETISNEELKSNLLDKVYEINSKTENALDKLRDLETEAQLAKLPYPLGMEAPAVSEIRNRINDINSNEALNDLEKEAKVKEIKDTFANLIEKINNAKDKIAKVSEKRQAALNDILNNSNLIVNDDVINNAEFEALDQAITNALNQDKSDAKDIIDSLSHLTNKQKEDFKNLIDEANSNNDIKKILDSAKLQDQKEDKKAELDRIIESLDYPNTNAEAKNELKVLYKEDKTLEELEQIKQLIVGENGVESKVNDANSKISKLPEAKQQALKDELNNASTNEEFEELFNKIAQALNDSKQEIKDEIVKLTHLTSEQRKELEKAVDAATNSTELNKILNKAKLLDKIEEAKSLITPNESYALADDPEVRNIIDRTINNMHKEADALETEAEVNNKIQELTVLNEKLKEVKNSIENLTNNEVSNLEETKKELAKKLARVNDIDDIPFVNFEIDKEKVKKLAESLDYPSKPNNVAISDIKLLIDQIDTTNLDEAKAKLDKIKNQIENTDAELPLATKIQEAKDKIAEIRQSDKVDRITPLEAELDRANTKEEFETLLNNIQIAKDAADKEWRDNLRDSLKKQAESLPYPAGLNAQGIKDIKNIIDSLTDDELVEWQTTKLNEIDKKIKEANKEIAKLSSDDQTRLNEKLNSANTDEEFNQLFEDIRNSSATKKQNITDAINSLNYLSRDEKDNFIAQLENATSEEMNEVLVEAKKQNIDNLIDTLPYPSGSLAKAKSDLKADIAKINNSNDLDSKLA
ncbi:ECM-binding protein homolog [Mycoplasmopsis maculosa]|uniref:ECM-binding protein homolog n=1 Tax=Mycoplasmopsis maculosa TaxID=114885 RepID=A0A449B3U9_9BACT|nr:GA module-containing protein [Mycoplasmopsis maculosa]VEU75260.1 ECM-binding protein homolog [Mycoplasmopsis maculosa]